MPPVFVTNGFLPAMEDEYCAEGGAGVTCLVVEWSSDDLSWADFQAEVVGAQCLGVSNSAELSVLVANDAHATDGAVITSQAQESALALAERYPTDPLFQFHLQRLHAMVFGVVIRMEDK
jgi:hypothetical protein